MNQLKLALRQLRLRPGLSFVVIVMLALGIGATTAMFSLYYQILVRPLPVPEPERLVNLAAPGPAKIGGTYRDLGIGDAEAQFSYEMFRELEARQTGFTGLAGHTDFVANLSFREQPSYSRGGALVSGRYFSVLNLRPALGRLIAPEDEPRVGESKVVVLSYDYWQRRFAGDPKVIGELLTVNGQELEIIGVAPEGFTGTILGVRMDVFVPLSLRWLMVPTLGEYNPSNPTRFFNYWLYVFGRLAPGVTLKQADAQLNSLYSGILNEVEAPLLMARQAPPEAVRQFRQRRIAFSPGELGWGPVRERAERPLELLIGVTALVLLIVCVNIANLLLARGAARGGEMAIRSSLGAGRRQLVKVLLSESFVLIAIGGLASLLVAALIVRFISGMLPSNLSLGLAALSPAAMLFAAGASLATVLVFGLLPAWRVSGANPGQVLNMQGGRAVSGRGSARFRATLTTAQIAFSMVLLVLAGLFTRSLTNIGREDLGIDVDSLVTFGITAQLSSYDQAELLVLYDRIEETLAAQPGVRGVGTTAIPLFYDFTLGGSFTVEGIETAPGADTYSAATAVGSGYFDTLDIPLMSGRVFTDRDAADKPRVAVVNQAFARKFNLGDDVVGRRLGGGQNAIEIVGLVADTKHASVKGDVPPLVYFPRRQMAGWLQSLWVYVRGSIPADALKAMIPRVMAEIAPDVPLVIVQTMRERVDENVYIDRLLTTLSTGFAALATLLAGIGLYGVVAYNVQQRTRELGLRLALGAEPKRLQTLVLKQVGVMASIGLGCGLAAALVLGAIAQAVLFGLSGRDPAVIGAAAVLLAAVVLAASWLPARRASRIAPTEALRYE
ncbi:MAG TPA: ABC transporter permease [Gammaproteobacteria bacterium]|nr:ABC transporter permease [Gammaproteobacteria bacterium]